MKSLTILALFSLFFVLASCERERKWDRVKTVAAATTSQVIVIQDAKLKPLYESRISSASATLTEAAGSFKVEGQVRDEDKVVYTSNIGDKVKVKLGDGKFKIKTLSDVLLWEVKIRPEKIKIAHLEEDANPYEIKLEETSRMKVKRGEETLGELRYDEATKSVLVIDNTKSTRYIVPSANLQHAFAVLVIDQIPPFERWVIMLELLRRP